MICIRNLLMFIILLLVSNSTVGSQAKKQDNVVGAAWSLSLYVNTDSEITLRVRATRDKKVFTGFDEIGRWEKIGNDKVRVEITSKDRPKYKGTMILNKSRNNPPTYLGKLKKADGTEVNARLVMIED